MAQELEFLEEISVFLERQVITPRSSLQDGELEQLVAIDGWETFTLPASVDPSGSENDKGTSSDSSSPKKNKRQRDDSCDVRRRKYRQRLKDEREELRQQAAELSKQVQEFMLERQGVNTTERTDLALCDSFWKRVALQQRDRRRCAEKEKARLSAIVNAQATYLQSLGMTLRECPTWPLSVVAATASNNEELDTLSDRKWLRLKSSDAALYETSLLETHRNNARLEQVFEECGMDSLPVDSVTSLRQHHPNGEFLFTQYVNKLLQPFSSDNASDCLWKLAELPHRRHDRQVFQDVVDPDNTVAVKFRLKKALSGGSTVTILKRVVSRRFIHNDSVVMVWKVFSEGEGIFSGMDVDETCWVRIRPYSDGSRAGALTEACSRFVPAHYIAANLEDAAVKAFQSMIYESLKEDEREMIKMMTKLLRGST